MSFWRSIKKTYQALAAFVRKTFGGFPRWLGITLALGVALFLLAYLPFFSAPSNFPSGDIVTIESGATVDSIAAELKQDGIIRSADVFVAATRIIGSQKNLIAGDYLFASPIPLPVVVARLIFGAFDLTPVHITIPEGSTVAQIGKIIAPKLSRFNETQFVNLAKSQEGYLFPDTYYFPPESTAQDVIAIMRANFNKQIVSVGPQIQAFGKPLTSVVIVASMLEKEAADANDRRIIAGIIWKRLSIGMPLQIDSTLTYALGVSTYRLTEKELATTSPYNTYRYKGLPAGPISNPGIGAITDALTPTVTPYLYYLSDKNGKLYYSATLAGQEENITQHL